MVHGVGTGPTSAGIRLPPGSTVADLVAALAAGGRPGCGAVGGPSVAQPIPSARSAPGATSAPRTPRPFHRSRPRHRAKRASDPVPVAVRSDGDSRAPVLLAGPVSEPVAVDPELPRPTIRDELAILGLSRRSHSRVGSRLFTLFFVLVFSLIIIQTVFALLVP